MLTLFSNDCPDCRRSVNLLNDHKINYRKVNIDTDTGYLEFKERFMSKYSDRMMPVLMDGDEMAWAGYADIMLAVQLGEIG